MNECMNECMNGHVYLCSRKASVASSARASSGQLSEAPSNAAAMPLLRSQPSGGAAAMTSGDAAAMPSDNQKPDAGSPPQGELCMAGNCAAAVIGSSCCFVWVPMGCVHASVRVACLQHRY